MPRSCRERGFALERRYEAAGFLPTIIEESHARLIEAELTAEPPPVVLHVVGGMLSSAGATAVDLHPGAWSWSSRAKAAVLTASDIDRALDAVPPSWPVPVVVVDVPLATSRREAASQLLLRNGFAGDLFALGGVRAVVATGLGGRKAMDLTQRMLVESLARGMTIGDVVTQMRGQAPEHGVSRLDAALAYGSIALWTNDVAARLPVAERR